MFSVSSDEIQARRRGTSKVQGEDQAIRRMLLGQDVHGGLCVPGPAERDECLPETLVRFAISSCLIRRSHCHGIREVCRAARDTSLIDERQFVPGVQQCSLRSSIPGHSQRPIRLFGATSDNRVFDLLRRVCPSPPTATHTSNQPTISRIELMLALAMQCAWTLRGLQEDG